MEICLQGLDHARRVPQHGIWKLESYPLPAALAHLPRRPGDLVEVREFIVREWWGLGICFWCGDGRLEGVFGRCREDGCCREFVGHDRDGLLGRAVFWSSVVLCSQNFVMRGKEARKLPRDLLRAGVGLAAGMQGACSGG